MKNQQKELFAVQAEICKALANAKRLEIIHFLGINGQQSAADLMKKVQLTKTNLSQNMRVLRQAEIVVASREGKQVSYRLASPKIGEACERLHEFLFERLKRQGLLAETVTDRKSEKKN